MCVAPDSSNVGVPRHMGIDKYEPGEIADNLFPPFRRSRTMSHRRGKRTRNNRKRARQYQKNRRVSRIIHHFWTIALTWAAKFAKAPVHYFSDTSTLSPVAPTTFRTPKRKFRSVEHAFRSAQARVYGENREARLWECGTGTHFAFGQKRQVANPSQIHAWSNLLFRKYQQASNTLGQKWRAMQATEMYRLCLLKFRTNPRARETLLSTGHAYLLYKNNEKPWGAGASIPDHELEEGPSKNDYAWGENRLGIILMWVRNHLRLQLHRHSQLTYRKKVRAAIRYRKRVQPAPSIQMLTQFIHLNPIAWNPQMKRMRQIRKENELRAMIPAKSRKLH